MESSAIADGPLGLRRHLNGEVGKSPLASFLFSDSRLRCLFTLPVSLNLEFDVIDRGYHLALHVVEKLLCVGIPNPSRDWNPTRVDGLDCISAFARTAISTIGECCLPLWLRPFSEAARDSCSI